MYVVEEISKLSISKLLILHNYKLLILHNYKKLNMTKVAGLKVS